MKKILSMLFVSIIAVVILVSCGDQASKKELINELESMRVEKLEDANEISEGLYTLSKQFQYTIGKVEEKGDMSNIELKIKTVDIYPYLEELFTQLLEETLKGNTSDEALDKIVKEHFEKLSQDKDLKYIEDNFDVKMNKVDGKWQIENKEEIVEFIKGNLKNRFSKIEDKLK